MCKDSLLVETQNPSFGKNFKSSPIAELLTGPMKFFCNRASERITCQVRIFSLNAAY